MVPSDEEDAERSRDLGQSESAEWPGDRQMLKRSLSQKCAEPEEVAEPEVRLVTEPETVEDSRVLCEPLRIFTRLLLSSGIYL